MTNKQIFRKILVFFIPWRLTLLVVTAIGLNLLPFVTQPSYQLNRISSDTAYWNRWANWDGGHFLSIAQNGYSEIQTVFFPLYPLLIKSLSFLGLNSFGAGFLISQTATIFLLFYFYKLILLDFDKKIAKSALVLLLIFPTSFYLGAVYSEALFLCLTIASFYYARKEKWGLAATLAGLSAITRLFGLIVILAVVIEFFLPGKKKISYTQLLRYLEVRILVYLIITRILLTLIVNSLHQINELIAGTLLTTLNYLDFIILISLTFIILKYIFKNLSTIVITLKVKVLSKSFLYLCLSLSPFITYLIFLELTFNSPTTFITSEAAWNRQLTSPIQTLIYYIQYLFNKNIFSPQYWSLVTLEIMIIILLIFSFFKSIGKLRNSYLIYYMFSILIPLSSGTTSAIFRYALTMFPFFIFLATTKNKDLLTIWKFFSVCLLALFSTMFINAYWVT